MNLPYYHLKVFSEEKYLKKTVDKILNPSLINFHKIIFSS